MPVYDVDYLHKPTIKTLIDYIQNRFQQFLGRHRAMWWLITLFKEKYFKFEITMGTKKIGCVIAYRKGHTNYGTSLVGYALIKKYRS